MKNNVLSFKNFSLPSDAAGISPASYNFQHLQTDFKFLNEKLSSISRDATQWDFLKIDFVLTDSSLLESAQYSLVPNTAFVVNCNSFEWKGESYSRGDIVYKDINNMIYHIQAERGGMWYPSGVSKNGSTYTITFDSVQRINPGEKTLSIDESLKEAYETISFTGIEADNGVDFYNRTVSFSTYTPSYSFNIISGIHPIIKGYDDFNEEIYWDCVLKVENGQYKIDLPKNIKRLVIK